MNAAEQRPGELIAEMMKRLWGAGMTTASGGNISLRDSKETIWTTPKGVDKGSLTADDIVSINPDGSSENKHGYLPTSELSFHRAIYRKRPDLNAIIHAHPPALSSFSFARKVPDTRAIPHIREVCGIAGFAPYRISGGEELAESISDEFRKGHHCVIMENHAAVVGGPTLPEAYQRFEGFEFCARTIINANKIRKYDAVPDGRTSSKGKRPDLNELNEVQSSPDELELRRMICKFVKRACRHQLMITSSGTVSARWSGDHFLITPDCKDRSEIVPPDIVQIKNGRREPDKYPDAAVLLHMAIYKAHPKVMSIMTASAPHFMAYGVAGVSMDVRTSPEGYVLLRKIAHVPFGSRYDGIRVIVRLLSKGIPCILIENDALLVTGGSVLQAFERLEVAEFTARSLIDTIPIGKPEPIDARNLKELKEKFLS